MFMIFIPFLRRIVTVSFASDAVVPARKRAMSTTHSLAHIFGGRYGFHVGGETAIQAMGLSKAFDGVLVKW
ncbi:hypothetical protein [Shinella sp. G-2]|uniref:hypothetical protein n=1 Tax=Shinella sp. G-2 TaxID=3133141 RepID=UPI003CFF95C8